MELLVLLAACIAAFGFVVASRHGDRRLIAAAAGILTAGALFFASLPFSGADASFSSLSTLSVRPTGLGASDVVAFEGSTYAAAKSALQARNAQTGTIVVAAVAPVTTTAVAPVEVDDGERSLSIHGPTSLLGVPAELWVVATWPTETSTDPDVAVLVKFASISLSTLNPDWPASMPVTLGPAIIGMTASSMTIDPNEAILTDELLSDGFDATDDAFDIEGMKLNLQAVITASPILDAAADVGGGTSGVRLRGVLGSNEAAEGGSSTIGISITADIVFDSPSGLPEWITLDSPWTLEIEADTGGNFSAKFTGNATVTLDAAPIAVTGTMEISFTPPSTTALAVTLEIGAIPNLFGQSWLDLNGAEIHASIDSDGNFAGGLSASLTLGPVTADLSLELSVGGGTTHAVIDLSATGPVSSSDILAAIGAPSASVSPSMVNVTLNALRLHVEITKSPAPAPTEVIVALFGDATLTINNGNFNTQMLFRLSKGAKTEFIVAARLETPTLGDLVAGIPFDWDLPDLAIVASNVKFDKSSGDLDAPTYDYFAPAFCEPEDIDADSCEFDVDVKVGLQIAALIDLPPDLRDQLAAINFNVDGPLRITGVLPLFGGVETSLEVFLPTLTFGPDDIVSDATVSFFIRKVGDKFTAGISGDMGFRITRSDQGDCTSPPSDGEFTNGDCYDTVDLEVTMQISTSTEGITLELLGTVSKWDNAFGQDWLDIQQFTLKIGFQVGPTGVQLEIGILGRLKFGVPPETKDLTLAIKVAITPTPPWVVLQGLTIASADGLGIKDIARMLNVDASQIPDLSLKNLWFSYGIEPDVDLCIRQGFYISAELHINAPSSTGADPGCTPEPQVIGGNTLPTQHCIDSDTCIAAILLDINTTPGPTMGFTAAASFARIDAGPIHIGPVDILLKVTVAEQRFRFHGEGWLDDPINPDGEHWADGSLTIEFSNNAGLVNLFIDGEVDVLGGYVLHAKVTGNVTADFSKIGSGPGGFAAFLASLDYNLTFEFSSEILEDIGETVEEGVQVAVDWGTTVAIPALQGAFDQVAAAFSPHCAIIDPWCKDLLDTTSEDVSTEAYFASVIQGSKDQILSKITDPGLYRIELGFYSLCRDVPYPGNCNEREATYSEVQTRAAIRNTVPAKDGESDADRYARAVNYAAVYGIHNVMGYEGVNTPNGLQPLYGEYFMERVFLNRDGACEPGGVLFTPNVHPVCTLSNATDKQIIAEIIGPVIFNIYPSATGFTLPPGTNGVEAVELLNNVLIVAGSSSVVQQSNGETRHIQALSSAVVVPMCATTGINYTTNTIAPLVVESNLALGTGSTTQPFTDRTFNQHTLSQNLINDIVDQEPSPQCLDQQLNPTYGNTAVQLSANDLYEGDTLTLDGFANIDGTPIPNAVITIDWGDGSTPTVVNADGHGSWLTSHVYRDDNGDGPVAVYDLAVKEASAAEARIIDVVVNNVTPEITSFTFSPPEVESFGSTSATVTWTDPGLDDSFGVSINWGDGTPNSFVAVPAGAPRSVTVEHTYMTTVMPGAPSVDLVASATVTDKDTLFDTETTDISVVPILPPVTTIIAKNANGSDYAPGTWTSQPVTISLFPSDTGHGPFSTSYGIDNQACGQSWPTGQFCTNYLAPFTITADGAHVLYIYSRDSRSTEYMQVFEVKIRKVAPAVVVSLPALPLGQSGFYNASQTPVVLSIVATDPSGVTGITCTVDGDDLPISNPAGKGTTSMTAKLAVAPTGSHHAVCIASNGANLNGAGPDSANTVDFKTDSLPPIVAVTGVAQGGTYNLGSIPVAGCSTTDAPPGSGVLTNATVAISGGNGNGAGQVTATCSGGKDKAGNTRLPVSATYTVVCLPTATYTGLATVKLNAGATYKANLTVTLKLNTATCAVTGTTVTTATAATGAIALNTTNNWKPPTSTVAGQWLFAMKTVNATTGGIFLGNAFRAMDGTSNLTVKFVNNRTQLYLKLAGMAPNGVGSKVGFEVEVSNLARVP